MLVFSASKSFLLSRIWRLFLSFFQLISDYCKFGSCVFASSVIATRFLSFFCPELFSFFQLISDHCYTCSLAVLLFPFLSFSLSPSITIHLASIHLFTSSFAVSACHLSAHLSELLVISLLICLNRLPFICLFVITVA